MTAPKILFEDEDFLVVDKPTGMVVNRAETTGRVETVQDWAETKIREKIEEIRKGEETLKETEKEFWERGGIVHRLDKDTSGLLVIAKTPEAFENLKERFKSRLVVKKYLALVHGRVAPETGTIKAPIARSPFNPKHFGVFPGGREAETNYKLLKILKHLKLLKEFSLLELAPHTGRTHQIRVHLKYINHPIVSDPIYGGRKNLREDLRFCPRLFLHAAFLRFEHPMTKKVLEFKSLLPPDLDRVLRLLK